MGRIRHAVVAVGAALAVAAVGGCSGDGEEGSPADRGGGGSTVPEVQHDVQLPAEIVPPAEQGAGINRPQPAAGLPGGYVEEEFLVGGTATGFDAVDTPDDGRWSATPADSAPYRTRVIVRRPADAEAFSGTVLVEWFNVSALEAAPDWGYLSDAIGREGHAYVGVSAQAQGVEGGETILDVEVDPDAASPAGASADASGLKNIDPERYGSLDHPGDRFSYDVVSQVGRAVAERPAELLGGLPPSQVIAMGESQSSMFLTTLINAVHPLDPVFDGFLVHSRGSTTSSLDGTLTRSRRGTTDPEELRRGVAVRDDLDVPVMIVEAETDLTLLGYVHARQPDTDTVRTWEIAGTAHADSETLRAVVGGPRDPGVGSLLGCGAVNSGPHKEVLRAALHHLVRWADGGPPPPVGPRLRMEDGDEPVVRRDEYGNALGGVRNPLVDVPVATLTGEPPGAASLEELTGDDADVCVLFGQTIPFDQETVVELHGTAEEYLARFRAASDRAVEEGFMLRPDADALLADVEPNRSLFP